MEPEMRIGDADRERVVGTLQQAFSEGHLDRVEFDERVGIAYTAKTQGELLPLTRDLPVRPPAAPAAASTPPVVGVLQETAGSLIPLLAICVITTLVWLFTGAEGSFWPKWVYLGMGIAMFSRLFAAYQRRTG